MTSCEPLLGDSGGDGGGDEGGAGKKGWVTRQGWVVSIVIIFGLGGHASTHALPVAAPLLEHLGLSPVAYATLLSAPILGQAPSLWGVAYERAPRAVTLVTPLVLLLGLLLMAAGLALKHSTPAMVHDSLLLLGSPPFRSAAQASASSSTRRLRSTRGATSWSASPS